MPDTTQLFLVRHGESLSNLTKEFSFREIDYSLTPKGVLQSEQTAEHFAIYRINAIYTSPLKRAQETAQVLGARLSLANHVVEAFREVNVGNLEGAPPDAESWALYDRVVKEWYSGNTGETMPGGESLDQLAERFMVGITEILGEAAGGTVVVVGHGGMFTFALPALCPSLEPAWREAVKECPNCSITEVSVKIVGGRPVGELVEWASADHLYSEAADLVNAFPV